MACQPAVRPIFAMDKEEPDGVDPLYAPSDGEEPKVDSMPVELDAEED